MNRREKLWLSALVFFAAALLIASWYVDEQADRTNLLNAAANGQADIAAATIEDGVNVNFRDKDGCTPLYHAANRSDIEIVRLLLANGADPTIPCYDTGKGWITDGVHPIHAASEREVIEALIAAGADVNARDANGNTPLHHLTHAPEALHALIAAGADPNATNDSGQKPVDVVPTHPSFAKFWPAIYALLGPPWGLWVRLAQGLP